MEAPIRQVLVPETLEARSFSILVDAETDCEWAESVPDFIRQHVAPKIPKDGKQYAVRVEFKIGGF